MLDTTNMDSEQKKKIGKALFTVFVLLAAFLGLKALSTLKEFKYIGRGDYGPNTITVTGTGEVFAIPDVGVLSFSVIEEGKSVSEAQDKASKKINSILDELKKMGIEDKDIKTTGYNSYPKYDYVQTQICTAGYCPPGRQILSGYEVSQTITLKIRKTSEAGTILTKVGDLGASNISGLDFTVDDEEKVKAEARDLAIVDARAKAKILPKSLGVRLVKIINFYESGGPIYYGMTSMEKAYGMGGDMTQVMPPQIPTGENQTISTVSIVYEID